MAPTLHLVRHAQGYHNLSIANHHMHDPLLTSLGEEQCAHLAANFPYHEKVDLVVASPIKRTIYTALLGFGDVLQKRGLKVIALPELQETSDMPCDTGSTPEELVKEFAGKPVDLQFVKEGWNCKRGKWAPTPTAIDKRAWDARLWLKARPEKHIVVVTHGGFVHHFTEDWSGSNKFAGTGWANTEYRSYNFSSNEPEEAHIVETQESRRRRRGEEKPLDREEQVNLKRTVSKDWEARGLYQQAQTIQAKV